MTQSQRIIEYGVAILGTTFGNFSEWFDKMMKFMHKNGFVSNIPLVSLYEMCAWVVDIHDPEIEDLVCKQLREDGAYV